MKTVKISPRPRPTIKITPVPKFVPNRKERKRMA